MNVPTHFRKVIKIKAEDSPNVKFGLQQKALGIEPTNEEIVPGVLSWFEYLARRKTWDKIRQCIGLDAEFYEGGEVLWFPTLWLNRAEDIAASYQGKDLRREAKGIGVDTGEGGDDTAWAVVDDLGVIELTAMSTPDTSIIPGITIGLIRKYNLDPQKVCFDLGGGGKEHVDTLRSMGFGVSAVPFGGAPTLPTRRGVHQLAARREIVEERYAFMNLRAEMYWVLRTLIDPGPTDNPYREGFGIPAEYSELRRQLAPTPIRYDKEGRIRMIPKNKDKADSDVECIRDLIGRSPDQADAVVLAIHAMYAQPVRSRAGVGV